MLRARGGAGATAIALPLAARRAALGGTAGMRSAVGARRCTTIRRSLGTWEARLTMEQALFLRHCNVERLVEGVGDIRVQNCSQQLHHPGAEAEFGKL